MKRIILLLLVTWICSLRVFAAHTVESIPNVQTENRNNFVSNPDGVLSDAAVARIDNRLRAFTDSTSAEIAVVAIDDFDPSQYNDADEFATALFDSWNIGKKDNDNGALVLIVRDRRNAVIRTGYGLEGALPDIVCGRIIRQRMAPAFRNGDYDQGTEAAIAAMTELVADPSIADEIRSNAVGRHNNDADFFDFLVKAGFAIAVLILIWASYTAISSRKLPVQEQYRRLNGIKPVALFLCFIGLGMPIPAYLLITLRMRHIRNSRRKCPNCATCMNRLDEEHDNDYLTPAQDIEERINSIDYDVWLCPECGETDIIPYVNRASAYTECPLCHARALVLTSDRIALHPTTGHEGKGVRTYSCRNCRRTTDIPYTIAKLAAPVVILPGGGGGFRGGGGIGGGFGGGMTGGGGASGNW